jgi:hypothetical protein
MESAFQICVFILLFCFIIAILCVNVFALKIEQRIFQKKATNFGLKTTFTFTHIFVGDQSGIMINSSNSNNNNNNNNNKENCQMMH